MKKVLFIAALVIFGLGSINAQEGGSSSLSKGSYVVEVNTGTLTTGNTAFSLNSIDGNTAWNLGGEAGYFIQDNLALKLGLGYGDSGVDGADGTFVYKLGAKYYVNGNIPVGLDFTGTSMGDYDPSYIGLQAGYAWFVAPNVSIEPTLRHNITLDDKVAESAFQALVGFSFHF